MKGGYFCFAETMSRKKNSFLFIILFAFAGITGKGQAILPDITVKDYNGKIVVSWKNNEARAISNISIQRSFDSLKNYTTIGTVLNPQNLENGFADDKAPFNRMYYRLFISFDGGKYEFSKIRKPEPAMITNDGSPENYYGIRYFWQLDPEPEPGNDGSGIVSIPEKPTVAVPDSIIIPNKPAPEIITYPSKRIYSFKESGVVLFLTDAPNRKYHVKFYDDADNMVLELNKLKEEYLIIEKYNFMRSGWYHFELYDNEKLIEKNKFYLGKDPKTNISIPRLNNR